MDNQGHPPEWLAMLIGVTLFAIMGAVFALELTK